MMRRLAFAVAVVAAVAFDGSTETCRFSQKNGPTYLAMEQAFFACDLKTAEVLSASLTNQGLSDCERKAVLQLDAMLRFAMGDDAKAAEAITAYLEVAGPDEPDSSAARISLSLILDKLGREEEAESQAMLSGKNYPVTGLVLPPQGCPASGSLFRSRLPPG
jgi:hypothetical protein